jgi:MoaA/NifB/PqqE/SkfB family radical SAM enzyme
MSSKAFDAVRRRAHAAGLARFGMREAGAASAAAPSPLASLPGGALAHLSLVGLAKYVSLLRIQRRWLSSLRQAWRKQFVFRRRLTLRKLGNLALCGFGFIAKRQLSGAVPVHVKVDIIPACQLRCQVCIHSTLTHAERRGLPRMMSVAAFRALVDQLAGRTMTMSLYNLGEPLLHPHLCEMIRYADANGINTYITSNFSIPLNDRRMEELVNSGLTMLIVAVDGISQQTYGPHRVGGKWEIVRDNLERFAQAKRRLGARSPHLLLQYITFDHNIHEVNGVQEFSNAIGIDQTIFVDGIVARWSREETPRAKPKPARLLPRCAWPYFSTLVNSDGTVVGCCNHRGAANYTEREKLRSMGDIRESSMAKIYAGEAYRTSRAMVSNPRKAGPQEKHFCSGCPIIAD